MRKHTIAAKDETPSATPPGLVCPDLSGAYLRQASTTRMAIFNCKDGSCKDQSMEASTERATELCSEDGGLRSHSVRISMSTEFGVHRCKGSSFTRYKLNFKEV
jgi:hypothetical protein